MRKSVLAIVALMFLLLLAGCGNSTPSTAVSTPEKVVKDYYDDLVKGNYTQAVGRLSSVIFDVAGIKPDEYANKLKESNHAQSLKVNEYTINETKEIDADHKYFKVLYKSTVNGKQISGSDELLAVKENGTWKVDPFMITKLSKMKKGWSWNMGGGKLAVSEIMVGERPDGKYIRFYIENKTNQTIQLGWASPWIIQVTTDKGTYTENGPAGIKILPGKRELITGVIKGASGVVKTAALKDINLLDDRGLPQTKATNIEFELKWD